jgi:hypothetical protein
MEFLKIDQLKLNEAGYLVNTTTNKPVYHSAFVNEQKSAEYFVLLAEAIKDKTFKATDVDNLNMIKQQVLNKINTKAEVSYVSLPEKPISNVNEELVNYALKFVEYEENTEKTNQINNLMQQFNTINSVSVVGDYFEEKLVKLTNLYSIEDVVTAAKIHVEKLY